MKKGIDTSDREEVGRSGRPPLRRDAQINEEKIKRAALELFQARGLDVPLEEIAQRAGVSIGTLYNRFGTREALTDAVMGDVASERLRDAVARARAGSDSWSRFATFVERVCEIQATEPAINDIVSRRHPDTSRLAAVCDETMEQARQFVDDAQRDGSLRDDFALQDLFLVFVSNGALMQVMNEFGADIWRRRLRFTLDGLRAKAVQR